MVDERRRRPTLGQRPSAAIPVLWALLADRGWSHARLAAEIDCDDGTLARVLYGVRKANRTLAARLMALGVPIGSWDEPLPDGWTLPHAAPDSSPALVKCESTDRFAAIPRTG